jgi:hypothetical protein
MENKKYHTVGTVSKSNAKIIERGKIDTPNIQIQERSLAWYRHFDKKWWSSTRITGPNLPSL